MLGEERRGYPLVGSLPGHRLGAVFTELEGRLVLLVRPGTARAVEAVGLVGAHQGQRRLEGVHLLAHRGRSGLERAPATGGTIVVADSGNLASSTHERSRAGPALHDANRWLRVTEARQGRMPRGLDQGASALEKPQRRVKSSPAGWPVKARRRPVQGPCQGPGQARGSLLQAPARTCSAYCKTLRRRLRVQPCCMPAAASRIAPTPTHCSSPRRCPKATQSTRIAAIG